MKYLFKKLHRELPVFMIKDKQYIILYSPGFYLKLEGISDNELMQFSYLPELIENQSLKSILLQLFKNALAVKNDWNSFAKMPFKTECLTLHAGSDCNLNCSYCYSKIEKYGNKDITGFPDLNSVEIICRYMVNNIERNTDTITVVYHGSGEPTFHWKQLVICYENISTFFKNNKLKVFNYIATNGNLTTVQVDWLAENMNLIGISCDGPAAIQNKQRAQNRTTLIPIEKICERIYKKGGHFEIRVTITRDTVMKQLEIVRYIIKELNAKNIRIEPFYLAGETGFTENEADIFFNHFIQAQNYANYYGVNLNYAGVRMDELHGTYCDVLRNTIRLTPDGLTRNCFCMMNNNPEFITGRIDNKVPGFNFSSEINDCKKKAMKIPPACHNCINVYHCSRGCPDFCIYSQVAQVSQLNPFRCRLHQLIAVERIKSEVRDQSPVSLLNT